MRCSVSSDDGDGGGPQVVCQTAGFPQAPMDPGAPHRNQAIIYASGQFSWRTANLGLAPVGQPDCSLAIGRTRRFQGWTMVPSSDDTTFINDATGHGMVIDSAYQVRPF